MRQTAHFFDLGYGWLCKHCSAADSERANQTRELRSGFFSHSEPEEKPAGLPLAGWADSSRHTLTCPRCGIEETITTTNQNQER